MFPSKEEKSFTTWSKPPLFLQNRQQVGAMKGKSSYVKEGVVKYKHKYNNAVVKYKREYNYNSGYKGVKLQTKWTNFHQTLCEKSYDGVGWSAPVWANNVSLCRYFIQI